MQVIRGAVSFTERFVRSLVRLKFAAGVFAVSFAGVVVIPATPRSLAAKVA